MPEQYNVKFTTPGGSYEASADTLEELLVFVVAGVAKGLLNPPQRDIESVARVVLESLRTYQRDVRGMVGHTAIATAGLELALIKCYLRGTTISQARDHLKREHGFEVSRSAVGRYWKHLYGIGAVPITEIPATGK